MCLHWRAALGSICRVKKYLYILVSFINLLAVCAAPVAAWADPLQTPLPLAPLLITEVQPGSTASASEEFIELFNTTNSPIDLAAHSWQLQIAGSTATDWQALLRTIALTGIVQPGKYYVVASQYTSGGQLVQYLPGIAAQWYSAGLSAAAGHIRLTYSAKQQQGSDCVAVTTVVDEVEWSLTKDGSTAQSPSLDGRSPFLENKSLGIPPANALQRYATSATDTYVDQNNDMVDFSVAGPPSPGAINPVTMLQSDGAQPAVPLPADACPVTPPTTGDGGGTNGQSPDSGQTGDTPGNPAQSDPGTPNGGQGAADPPPEQALLPVIISELLPNPAAPQTDEADEFVELYNPNTNTIDLSGYTLTVGTATTHTYAFPEGTTLAGGSYTAFFSAQTGLSLSNSGGQARLADPQGTIVAETDIYDTAKDGQAWAFINGSWQWTDSPTPNAPNAASAPPPPADTVKMAAVKSAAVITPKKASITTAPKTATAAAKPKSAAPKKATAKAKAAKLKPKATATITNTADTKQSLHPLILASVALLAVLYGAYEYRHDMANHIRKFRDHRAHRRSRRPAVARRRDD